MEIKFFKSTGGYTLLDQKGNEILEELVERVENKIQKFKST